MTIFNTDVTSVLMFLFVCITTITVVLGAVERYVIPNDIPLGKLLDTVIFVLVCLWVLDVVAMILLRAYIIYFL